MGIGLGVAISLGVLGMVFQALSMKRLSPMGQGKRRRIEKGLEGYDPRNYSLEGRRYRVAARVCLVAALVLTYLSVMA